MTRSVLYASDFSPASRRAFQTALTLASVERAALTVVHVVVPLVPLVPEQYIEAATWERINGQARRWGSQQLARLAAQATKKGVKVTTLLLEGDPAEEVARAARSKRADLVVVGTHGRGGLKKWLLGSVAEKIVGTAPCPVVTVRAGK